MPLFQGTEPPSEDTPLSAEAHEKLSSLSDTHIRHGFIRKVYGILFSQLVLTFIVGGLVMRWGSSIRHHDPALVTGLMFTSLAVSLCVMCVFTCNPGLLQKPPQNYALLFFFTLAESCLVGFISCRYTQESVLIVVLITAVVVVGLTLFACQTKYDFSGLAPYIFAAVCVMAGIGLVFMIAALCGYANSPAFRALRMVYAGIGAALFSFYIVFDTQQIVGGKHVKFQFGVDDYCMAAITLYMDIIQLFLFLLELFGSRK